MIKRKYYKVVIVSFLFGVFMWVVDAFIDSIILHEGTFIQSLFPLHFAHQHEFFYRMLFVGTFTVFGFVVAYLFSRHDVDISKALKRSAITDMVIGGFLLTGVSLLIFAFDISERIFSFFQDKEHFQIDELFLSLFIIILSLFIFAYRRWNESLVENKQRVKVEEDLRSALKNAEDEKAKSEGILASMGEAISMQNLDLRVMYQNKAHKDLVGDHFGEYCYKAYQKKDHICESCHLVMAFNDGQIHTVKQSRTTDDGIKHYEIVSSPLKDSSGKVIAGIEMVREVTENVQRERMLAEQSNLALLRADIGTALTQGDTLREMLQKCSEAVVARMDVAFARIWTLNKKDNVLELQASAGLYTHIDGAHSRIPVGKYKIGIIAQEKLSHITNKVIGDPKVNDQDWAKREGIRAFAGYPLFLDDDVIGVFGVFSRNVISDNIARALESISDKISLGIGRKNADIELQRSEYDLKNLFESVNDAVFVLDLQGNFIDINSTAYTRLGYAREEMLSMHITELDPPEFAVKVPERFAQIAKHGKAVFESAHIRKDGTVMPVEVNSVLTIFRGKEVLLSTIRDITQRKAAERALMESEEKFRTFFSMAPVGIVINPIQKAGEPNLGQKFKHAILNNVMSDMLGYTQEELGEMIISDITYPEDLDINLRLNAELIAGQRSSYTMDKRYLKKDGSIFWGHLNVTILKDGDGVPSFTMTILTDISDIKRAEEALSESEESYRSLAENLPAIVYRVHTGQDGSLQLFNDMFEPMTGFRQEELSSGYICSIVSLIVSEDRENVINAVNDAVLKRSPFNVEYRIIHRDGDCRYFQEYGIPVYGIDGKPLYIDGVIFDITNRKLIENELAQSRVEWEDTFNNITDVITIHDKDFNIIQANKAAMEMLNLPVLAPGKERKCFQYYHGTASPPEKCASCECLSTGRPATFEMYEPAFDKYFEVRAMPRFNTNNEIVGVSHIVRDISFRKAAEKALKDAHDMLEERVRQRTEELQKTNEQLLDEMNERIQLANELQESERRYRRFFEDSPTSLLEADFSIIKQYVDRLKRAGVNDFRDYFYSNPDEVGHCATFLKITDVNTVTLEIYKASSKKEFLENLNRAFCEETYELFTMALIAVAENSLELEAEGITQDFNGNKNHISLRWSVQSGSEKTLSKVLISIVDITERKKAEDALVINEKRLRAITDSTTDLIWEKDTINDVLNWFGDVDALLGYDPGGFPRTVTGHMEHIHPNERGRITESIEKAISTRSNFSAQYRIRCKEGTYRIWDERGKPVGFENEKPVKWVGSITDITEKVRLEEEAKFMQAKLLHANKMTALGTLVSGVAHEINNPNTYIMSNAEVLSMVWADINSLLSESYKNNKGLVLGGIPYSELRNAMPKLLKGITEGSNRIRLIIDNLKDFSRPEKANLDEDVDMNEVIKNSMAILGQQIKEHTSHFSTHCMKNIPIVKGNRQQLEQVIINLISNSIQSLPAIECGVRVSTLYNKDEDSVMVTIKDEGTGIPAVIIDRITEPFFTTKIDSGGTGLGLYISYAIINDHKGSMKFESIEGKGTTVMISLPVSQ